MKNKIFAAALMLLASGAMAQNEYNALQLSQTYQQGTARSTAMGGAFGALGGDISCLSNNPAGIAIYSAGELCFTPEFISNDVEATANGRSTTDTKYAMKFSSLGFVSADQNQSTTGFSGWAWGIAYNRLNDYSLNERLRSVNNSSSLLDVWCDRAAGLNEKNLEDELSCDAYLGYDAYLLEPDKNNIYGNPHYASYNGGSSDIYGQLQSRTQNIKGGVNSWDFTFGAGFAQKFYFGGSLGIQSVNIKRTSVFEESDNDNRLQYDYWNFKETEKTNGAGINLKLGFLAKPTNYLRLGAAIHTPTMYSLSEQYDTEVAALFDPEFAKNDDESTLYESAHNNDNDYRFVTPFKAILSGAFIVPGYGLVSLDYERVDYSKMRYETADNGYNYSYDMENDAIKDKFQATNNIRLGLEGLVGSMAIRAGYAMYGNPYKFVSGQRQRQILSFGLGFRSDDFYVDLGASYHIYQTDNYLYESNNVSQLVTYDNRYLHVMMTFGFKF